MSKAKPIVLQCAVVPSSLRTEAVATIRWTDALAVALFIVVAVIVIVPAKFRDYRLGWDDYT